MIQRILLLLFAFFLTAVLAAQSVGIGTNNPSSNAILELSSNNKGFLPPRMSSSQRLAIANPVSGLMVYDYDLRTIFVYSGNYWAPLNGGNTALPNAAPLDAQPSSFFGESIAVNETYLVVGAYNYKVGANTAQGAAYVYEKVGTNWVQVTKLLASDGAADDWFGYSVAIYGDWIVIGAPMDDNGANSNQGSAYVFFRNAGTWTQMQKITGNLPAANDQFGWSVAMSNTYCCIGGIGVNANRGAAYWFLKSGNTFIQTQRFTGTAIGDSLGYRVSLVNNYLIASAPSANIGVNNDQGYCNIYFFNGSTWTFQSQILASDPGSNTQFGHRAKILSASGDSIAVSTRSNVSSAEKVYLIKRTGAAWAEQQIIYSPTGQGGNFGISITLQGDFLYIGTAGKNTPTLSAGSIEIYTKSNNTWTHYRSFDNPNPFTFDLFGIAIDSNQSGDIVIGASGKNQGSGLIYFLNF